MIFRKLLKIILGLLILFAVAVGLTSINHPIILKWVTGSAKHHGAPMPATVYTNGLVDDRIKVYYTDEQKNYLVSFTEYDSSGNLKFINIDLKDQKLSTPVSTSKDDYDFIAGHLFQSETGKQFSPLKDNNQAFNFDPQLSITGKQIKFNMPPNISRLDSVRLILP